MDDYRIEGHKLMFHISRVHQWLNGEFIYPVYIEIGPSGTCNQRCIFCALDYLDYKPQYIDTNVLMDTLSEMAQCGVKSVMFAGEGEPLLHKNITRLIVHTKKVGIDVAITTNGVFFKGDIAQICLPLLTWMRISLNGGTPQTYAEVHRCSPEDYEKVLNNIAEAVKLKRKNHYACTIGVQFLLLAHNYHEVSMLAKQLKDKGVDYLIIKPYSQHPLSKNKLSTTINYSDYMYLDDELQKLSNSNFRIIFRDRTMRRIKEDKSYKRCLGLPFFAYLASNGELYACSAFLGREEFCYGNIYKNDFRSIMNNECRKEIIVRASSRLDVTKCRQVCRMDKINSYLWELKNSGQHVNFI